MIEMKLSELYKYDPISTQLQLAFVFLSLKPLVVRSVGASMLPRRVFCHSRLRLRSCLSSEEWRSWDTICRVNIVHCADTIYGRMATNEGLCRGKVMSIFVCLGRCILLGSECSFFVNQAPNAVFCSKMIQCSLFPYCIKSTWLANKQLI